jgi:hypothetical protein
MRAQSGTTSLRALLYMDEIFGYFPPVSNPPSKAPLLTLLKQARAYGLGIVLATQNPVDLDYKGLANAGTWFIGRLQTERDKARLLEGLEGASAAQGARFDRQAMEQTLASLGSRVFLMNNVHEDAPVVFETRWTLSYLRGPLTKSQIKTLTDPVRPDLLKTPSASDARGLKATGASAVKEESESQNSSRPMLPPDVPQFFIPARRSAPSGASFVYVPMVYGFGEAHISDEKRAVDVTMNVQAVCPIVTGPVPVNWNAAQACEIAVSDLEKEPAESSAGFGDLPSVAATAKSYAAWTKDFENWIYRNPMLSLFKSPSSGVYSKPGESERDFRVRLQLAARETRDGAVEALRRKYAPKIAVVQERLRRAQQAQEFQSEQATSAKVQTVISFGATLLGALLGRKGLSLSSMGRATTAARGVARTMKESADAARAGETVEAVEQQLKDLNSQLETEIAQLTSASDPALEKLDSVPIKPKKKDIRVKLIALVWAPHLREPSKPPEPAW